MATHSSILYFEGEADIESYSTQDCTAALRGERVPQSLTLDVTRLCVVQGIRRHPGFAEELYGREPLFTRALNARKIMSDVVPNITQPEDYPYCIWYPDVARQETYRILAQRYPQMRYLVGRACAVAGYTDLYHELDILPEVHIAEEARESGSQAIFISIMDHAVKYSAMDDYTRTIKEPVPANLDGDTAVRSLLAYRQKFKRPMELLPEMYSAGYDGRYFNITEDMGVDDYDESPPTPENVLPLLYSPLPADLPTPHKDLLILMAAYYGNIDRYARLRRPVMIPMELNCIVRGIYHNTMFAKWWSLRDHESVAIAQAINARFIMSNDLSRAANPKWSVPYCIWYPGLAEEGIYVELARLRPEMKIQAARACIVADYEDGFDKIDPDPTDTLLAEASAQKNDHYLRVLEDKAAKGPVLKEISNGTEWKACMGRDLFEREIARLYDPVGADKVVMYRPGIYNGKDANIGYIELNVCASDEAKSHARAAGADIGVVVSVEH